MVICEFSGEIDKCENDWMLKCENKNNIKMNKSNIVMFSSFIIKDLIVMKYLSIVTFYHYK